MERKEANRSAYCPKCEFFVDIDNTGCCVECGQKILEPKAKLKKAKKK